ncbi:hypothetical protein V8E52_010866 [Russula decolorans]
MVLPSIHHCRSFPVTLIGSSPMQSSRGPPPPHGATPSPPTDRSHSTHSSVPSSFHTPESVPPPSSPPFFAMNPLTDQRLTGSMMPYHHHHALPSTSTYQDTVPWQYAASWDAPVLDAGASSEHPSSTSLNPLGMVSPSNEGSTFAPPLPPPRAAVHSRNTYLGAGHPGPPRPFPASPPSSSTSDAHETSVQFHGGGVNVGASSAPATSPPHLSQGAANPATMQPFTSSPDIWQPSHNAGVNVCPSPVTTTTVIGGLVTSSLGENLKGKVMQRRSPTELTRGSARYDPVGKQARVTSRPAVVTSAAAPATTIGATGSEQFTDEGDERDSDGSVRGVRDKKRRYAKTFRDIEKQLFEKLRHRLFPQDPHAKRSECLERAIESVDELLHLRESEARHHKEIEDLRQQLADAEHRTERLYRELNGRSLTMGS